MSNDIVERLREWIKPHATENWQFSHYPEELNPSLLAEAADEIEKLRHDVRYGEVHLAVRDERKRCLDKIGSFSWHHDPDRYRALKAAMEEQE